MKTLPFLSIIGIALLFSCKKSTSAPDPRGNQPTANLVNTWQLVQVNATVGPKSFMETPSADSSVLLIFKPDSTFASFLNGQPVSQGSFSLSTDFTQPGYQLLEMNNFETTGLLAAAREYLDTGIGPLILISDKKAINISHDTLYMTPGFVEYGGWAVYVFLKQ